MTLSIPLKDRLSGFDPRQARSIHILGVCGTGMGALARLLKARGYAVTGSDEAVYPPMSDFLREWGIPVRGGFKASHLLPRPDLVVVGNVVSRDHEVSGALLASGIPYLSFPEAVRKFFLRARQPIVVCGTHGKTTTTGLIAWTLRAAGRDPGFFFGGIIRELDTSSHDGKGDFFVMEGDEYDTAFFDSRPKFVHYRPRIAIVGGIEFDHADLYRDMGEMKKAFALLREREGEGRRIIFQGDNAVCRELFGDLKGAETFGLGRENRWSARDLRPEPGGTRYELLKDFRPLGEVFLPLWGRHNVLNSLSCYAACARAGLSVEEIRNGLRTFPGIKRRQEIFYVRHGVTMIDDFAHHPTAVRETIAAARAHNPASSVIAVFEPRSNTSRSDVFQKEYERAFDDATEVILYRPIRKNTRLLRDRPFLDMGLLRSKVNEKTPCRVVTDRDDLIKAVMKGIHDRAPKKKLVLLIMSNGGFEGIYRELPGRMDRSL